MMSKTVIVLDPAGVPKKKEFQMAARPDKLEGKVMGIIWNIKPGGDILFDRFTEQLDRRFHFAQILRQAKISQAYGASEDILNEFAAKCDFVITGQGD